MPIITSIYTADPPDDLGRMAVIERHLDHTGREHMVSYTCPAGCDIDAIFNRLRDLEKK